MLNIDKLSKRWTYRESKKEELVCDRNICLVPKLGVSRFKRIDFDVWYNENSETIDIIIDVLMNTIVDVSYFDNEKYVQFNICNKNVLENELINWLYEHSYNSLK